MKERPAIFIIALCISGFIAAWMLLQWLRIDGGADVVKSVPGMDDPLGRRRAYQEQQATRIIQFGAIHHVFDNTPADIPGRWPHFRGPDYRGISDQDIPLAGDFGPNGPVKLWELVLGQGYGGAAVYDGAVYVLDYIDELGDVLRCFSLEDGSEIWRTGYPIRIASNHGITRTIPTVTEEYVLTIGPMGHVMCVERESGKVLWGLDLVRDFGTRDLSSVWYAGQCPFVDGDTAIIAPVGTNVLMMAVECATGDILWTVPNERAWRMSHASITPMTVDGVKKYIYPAVGGVVAVGAEGEHTGKILWETDEWTSSVVMPSPVVLQNDRLFVTSGYGGGSAIFKITRNADGEFSVEAEYNYGSRRLMREGFSTYMQTAIYHEGHLFGLQLNDARNHRTEFVCVNPEVTGGEFVWNSGPETDFTAPRRREAWGPYILADNKFYVMGDTSLLVVFEATTAESRKLGEWQLLEDGYEAWGPLVISGGRLIMRDLNRLICYDIRKETYE